MKFLQMMNQLLKKLKKTKTIQEIDRDKLEKNFLKKKREKIN